MEKVCVAGGGTMGLDIALLFALKGISAVVRAREVTDAYIQRAESRITKSASRLCAKEIIDEETRDSVLARISFTSDLQDASDCDLIIEAIIENMEEKKRLFAELDKICKEETVFATNTSSISITELSSVTNRPDRFIGMHFFNPATVMKPVEVVRSAGTSDETFETIYKLTEYIGKTPVAVHEAPGFVVNRILIPMINEAVGVLADKTAEAADIDKLMQLGANHPLGPLALSDLIGNDVILNIMDTLRVDTGDDKYAAHPILRDMVRDGLLGKKSGKGFYDYSR